MKLVIELPTGYAKFYRMFGRLKDRSAKEEIETWLKSSALDLMGQVSKEESILLFGEVLGPDEIRERFGTLQDKLG